MLVISVRTPYHLLDSMTSESMITVLIPALNEEAAIRRTIEEVRSALDATFPHSEIIACDDGSTDATGRLMEEQARLDPRVHVIHHASPMGLGHDYWEAAQIAKGESLTMVPGDAEITGSSIELLFREAGKADIVSCYAINPVIRGFKRRFVSRTYVFLINTLFGYGLRYYNGPCLVRTSLLRTLPKPTASFAYMTETVVRLLDQGATIREIEMTLRKRPSGKTKAFALKNVTGVVKTIGSLFWSLRVQRSTS